MDNFAIFIISYNRPRNIRTLNTLLKSGYTGDFYIIISDDDPSMEIYKELYPKNTACFNKDKMKGSFDICDIDGSDKICVYARNFCFEFAKKIGLKYFLEFDDDYDQLVYRFPMDNKLKTMSIKEFDKVCEIMIKFLEDTDATAVAFAQNGDFIGGCQNKFISQNRIKRKCMNSWFCRVDKPFSFIGRMNDDVNTYMTLGSRGQLFLTVADVSLHQEPTQGKNNGMSEIYLNSGTYQKSFYTVMNCPSFCKIGILKDKYARIHHRISWNNAVPKIINEKYKK